MFMWIRTVKFLFVLILFSLFNSSPAIELNIVYPTQRDTIRAAAIDSNFIYGSVSPANAQLIINDQTVPVQKNGTFLAYLPIRHGLFAYKCEAKTENDSTVVQRFVYYPAPKIFSSDTLHIDSASFFPKSNVALPSGEVLKIQCRGTPGQSAFFRIGRSEWYSMVESRLSDFYWGEAVFGQGGIQQTDAAGWYRGSFVLTDSVSLDGDAVQVKLVNAENDTLVKVAPGQVRLWPKNPIKIVETALDLTVLRTGYHQSYYFFLPRHVRLHITGVYGDSYRVQLSPTQSAWVERYKVDLLPEAKMPRIDIKLMRTEGFETFSRLWVYTTERIPFRVQQSSSPQTLKVIFYGVTANTDWIRRDFDDQLFKHISWQQESDGVYSVTIELNQNQQWGYEASYEKNRFFIDIKKTPKISRWKRRSLQNKTILLDPGHEPDTGAIGPSGFKEKDANLQLALTLAKKLQNAGARVKFTRQQEGSELGERLRLAMITDADVLLSLHHNGVPAGVNPLKNHGTSTYYYHPQSYELARRIQKHLLDELDLSDFGLFWDNLAMCRPTQMPAVLIEPAFMILPEEEALIATQNYRDKCASAIVKALQEFFTDFRH